MLGDALDRAFVVSFRDAENLLVLRNTDLAAAYAANFERRKAVSEQFTGGKTASW